MGYTPNIPHLQVGYNPFTNHLLTSWDIQANPNPLLSRAVQKTRWRLIEPQGMGRPQRTVEVRTSQSPNNKLNVIYPLKINMTMENQPFDQGS